MLAPAYWSAFWTIASIQFVVAVDGEGPVPLAGAPVGVLAVVAVAGGAVGVVEVVGVVGVTGTEVVGACVFGADGLVGCTRGCEVTACTCGVLATALAALTP
jgi:hypothetical protein